LFVLPEDLPIELTPFAFLVGNWQGTGVISFGETETEFRQSLSFEPIAGGRLDYQSTVTDLSGKPGCSLGQAMSQMPGLVLFQEAE
jgi:hypothetical protein